MTILYNTQTAKTGQRFNPQYLVDGKPGKLPDHLIELAIVEAARPFTAENEVATSEWVVDTAQREYRQEWTTRPKTEIEIQEEQIENAKTHDSAIPVETIKKILRKEVEATAETESDLLEYADLFESYRPGKDYNLNERFWYEGKLFKVLQPHTSAIHWKVTEAVSLYVEITPPGQIVPWKQPAGAHDAYEIGVQVTHNSQTWENTTAANVYEPGVYGWIVV